SVLVQTGGRAGARLILWDVATGKERKRWDVEGGTGQVAFNRAGDRLLGGAPPRARPWAARALRPPADLPQGGRVSCAAFSPDGLTVATGGVAVSSGGATGAVRLWDAATGEPRGGPLQHVRPAPGSSALAFSPDGQVLAAGNEFVPRGRQG